LLEKGKKIIILCWMEGKMWEIGKIFRGREGGEFLKYF
jgi:hypothetical protein